MIDIYQKYYLSDDKVEQILKSGIIVFDTSALLDLYYYSSDTQKQIFDKVFVFLTKRLWIPSQVYYEYLKNKSKVAEKPILTYQNLATVKQKGDNGGYVDKVVAGAKDIQNKKLKEIANQLKSLKEQTSTEKKHPHMNSDLYKDFEQQLKDFELATQTFVEQTETFQSVFLCEIEKHRKEIQDGILPDSIFQAIDSCFEIGKEYTFERMFEISQEGEYRYNHQIPPGYEDDGNKIGLQKYGDLFLWKQILDQAKKKQMDFILVTNDLKSDWFEDDKKTPRFELLKEFNGQSNKSIWLLSMQDFIYKINALLDEQLAITILDDINSVQEDQKSNFQNTVASMDVLQNLFNNLLEEEMYLIDVIPQNESIRLFNNPEIYDAEDMNGNKFRIVCTILGGGNYASMLHGMTNATEIKKFYSSNKEFYRYYNFIIAKNKVSLDKCIEHLGKTKVKKLFGDKSIRTLICYFDEGNLQIAKTNFEES